MIIKVGNIMPKIVLGSWREGLEKVSLSKIQMSMLGKSLSEAKGNVDSLLDGEKVIIEVDDMDLAQEFCNEAERIGVNCKLIITE